ncbi:hypothetical protein [Bacteroides acidifaciens]|uniref:hypothetical protein n=1 Tax=Bacteroides acidifaciens TaxID=85831 RepID=UPI0025A9615D|nr:hypothetical protein [Bacteroides acidifaciens]
MAILLERLWNNLDGEGNLVLLNRPRVSIEIDRYIWDIIEQNIVLPKNIMQSKSYDYKLVVSLGKYNPEKQQYFKFSPYNGSLKESVLLSTKDFSTMYYSREDFIDGIDRQRWFSPEKFWTNSGDKITLISADADNVTEKITPSEYADLLFDAFGAFLVYNFKKIKKSDLDMLKTKIDNNIVCGFPFPAPFSEQQYQGDDSNFRVTELYKGKETALIDIPNVSVFYKRHYKEE